MKTFYTFLLIAVSLISCTKPEQDELSVGVAIPTAFVPISKDGTINSSAPCTTGEPNCNTVFRIMLSNPNNIEVGVSMEIYDSHAQTVFSSTEPNPMWNGTKHNAKADYCPQGNYHYLIEITEVTNGKSRIYEGDVALLR